MFDRDLPALLAAMTKGAGEFGGIGFQRPSGVRMFSENLDHCCFEVGARFKAPMPDEAAIGIANRQPSRLIDGLQGVVTGAARRHARMVIEAKMFVQERIDIQLSRPPDTG